jgi:hypothetical protein
MTGGSAMGGMPAWGLLSHDAKRTATVSVSSSQRSDSGRSRCPISAPSALASRKCNQVEPPAPPWPTNTSAWSAGWVPVPVAGSKGKSRAVIASDDGHAVAL